LTKLPSEAYLTGTQINYYLICPTKLWLFTHQITMEDESEKVQIGKYIHETAYAREKKNVIIDDKIALDFVRQGDKLIICEVKKSMKLEKAHLYQLYYYLYYLHKIKGIEEVEGLLLYPEQRTKKKIKLTEAITHELEIMLSEINKIIKSPQMPKPVRKSYCKSCAYFEFCWG